MKKGFTIMELVIVLVVLGILGTLLYGKFSEITLEAKAAQLSHQLKKIEVGMTKYLGELSTYPADIKWLTAQTVPSDDLYDILALKGQNATVDSEVKNYWSGPYVTEMSTTSAGIKAALGDNINICIDIDASGLPKKCTLAVGTQLPVTSYGNVLYISGLDPEIIPYVYKAINGIDITSTVAGNGNLLEVAEGTVPQKLGIPKKSAFSTATSAFVIYRYADNFQ